MSYQTCGQLFDLYNFVKISITVVALWKYNEPEKAKHLNLAL